jgi:hypothetical protein
VSYESDRSLKTAPHARDDDTLVVGIGVVTYKGITLDTLSVPQARLLSALVGPDGRLRREVPLPEVARVVYRRHDFDRAVARALRDLAARTSAALDAAGVPLGLRASCRDDTLSAWPRPAQKTRPRVSGQRRIQS